MMGYELPTWVERLDERWSKAQIQATARELNHDELGISQVYGILLQPDATQRAKSNAAWLLAHLSAESKQIYLSPKYDGLAGLAITPQLTIRRGLILAILLDLTTPDELPSGLFDFCLQHIADKAENDSTRAYMIHLLVELGEPYPELLEELALHLEILPCSLSASIVSAKRQALKRIENILKKNKLKKHSQK